MPAIFPTCSQLLCLKLEGTKLYYTSCIDFELIYVCTVVEVLSFRMDVYVYQEQTDKHERTFFRAI